MSLTKALPILCCAATSIALTACGGGSTIGGEVSGLGTGLSVVLQNNGADNLSVTANGSFSFATSVDSSAAYSVTVLTQPAGQTCTVSNGSGTVDTAGDSVTSVAVSCTTTSSLGGTVSGLPAGTSLTLSNAGVTLPVAVSGPYAFAGLLATGSSYNVTIVTQPAGHFCTIANPSGTIAANVMAVVDVVCI